MMYEKKELPHLAYLKNLVKYTLEYYEFYSPDQAKLYYITRDCCGSFVVDKYYYEKFSPRNNYMIIAVEKGQVYFDPDDGSEPYVADAGEILLIDCYKPQHYGALCDSCFYYMHISGEAGERFLSAFTESNMHVLHESEPEKALYSLITDSVAECRNGGQSKDSVISAKLYRCLCDLFDEYNPSTGDEYINVTNQFVKAAIEYIKQNFDKKIELNEMAASLSISVTYLSHIFKTQTGKSPYHYVTEYRLQAAKYMLANQTCLIKEIAYSCGFSSAANFIYAFRKAYGISPGEYRDRYTKVVQPVEAQDASDIEPDEDDKGINDRTGE